MDWQLLLTGVCVGLATLYLARRSWRTWTAQGQGCAGCSCAGKSAPASAANGSPAALISADMLTARLRGRG